MPYTGTLFDLQLNGYRNVSFTDSELTQESCRTAFSQYLEEGADGFLATVITAPDDVIHHSLSVLAEIREEPAFSNRVPGFHLEGPFLSPEPGARGAHNPDWMKAPCLESFKRYQESAAGMIKLVTIAADVDGAAEFCRTVTDTGVSVSLGHHLAGYDDLSRLADAGAKTLTHLGNGTPHTAHKFDNPFVNGLFHPGLRPMIIPDGHHVPPHVIAGIIRLRGADDLIFVSDASPLAGMPPGEYFCLNNACVIEEDGRLHNPEKGYLVGSSYSMRRCAEFLESLGVEDSDIELMGYGNALGVIS